MSRAPLILVLLVAVLTGSLPGSSLALEESPIFGTGGSLLPAAGHENDQNERRVLNGAGQFIDFLSGIQPTKQRSYSGYPEKTPWPTD